jgi:hypothetical protein
VFSYREVGQPVRSVPEEKGRSACGAIALDYGSETIHTFSFAVRRKVSATFSA